MNKGRRIRYYLFFDWLSSLFAWISFNVLRYGELGTGTGFNTLTAYLIDSKALILDIVIPLFWVGLSALSGYYHDPRRKSPGTDSLHSIVISLTGTLLIFFTVIINDLPENYTQYYILFVDLFILQTLLLLLPRALLNSRVRKDFLKGKDGIPTLVIGQGREAGILLAQHRQQKRGGHDWIKATASPDETAHLDEIIRTQGIEHIIVALDTDNEAELQTCIDQLYRYRLEIHVFSQKAKRQANEILLKEVGGIPLRRITPAGMYPWERNIKRISDIIVSCVGLILIIPLMLYLMLRVKLDSKGPVFFMQERLGKNAKPFKIIKFRTMYTDAEAEGPRLSSANDKRITPFGVYMRRYRLDELPQLINVIKGDMSLVGPRPERPYYAREILKQAPHYELVYSVRPGITSLGMAKFGYANSVEKMLQRLNYDIIYLSQASLLMDLKILAFTVKPLVAGSGV